MKKMLISLFALAASTSLMAQNGLTVIENPDADYYAITCLSPDGHYAAGSTLYGMQAFIYNVETQEGQIFDAMDKDYGDMVLSVANDGTGVGYGDAAYAFTFEGALTPYTAFTTLQGISADGKFMVGNYKKETTEAGGAYWSHGQLKALPEPTEDELGFACLGSYARFVSADSSIICGNIVDKFALMPAVLWRRGTDGTYKLDAFCTDYSTQADSSNPYMVFSPTGMSENGEWVALWLTAADETGAIGRYNTKTRKLEVYVADGTNGDFTADPLTSGIANDGTLVGYTSYAGDRQGFIWEAGKSEPELLANRFPLCTEFADYDGGGFHTPSAISADGRYIAGFGLAGDTYNSYVLDTKTADETYATGITTATSNTVTLSRYAIDGKRLTAPMKGLNIERRSDGTTVKILNTRD